MSLKHEPSSEPRISGSRVSGFGFDIVESLHDIIRRVYNIECLPCEAHRSATIMLASLKIFLSLSLSLHHPLSLSLSLVQAGRVPFMSSPPP